MFVVFSHILHFITAPYYIIPYLIGISNIFEINSIYAIKFAIFMGDDINQVNKYSQNALIYNLQNKNKETILFLIYNGVNVSQVDSYGETALTLSIKTGRKEIVPLLIYNGANVNQADKYGYTPLMLASIRGYKEVAEILINKGAAVNKINSCGNNAFMFSLIGGDKETVELLINRGGEVNLVDGNGHNALMVALFHRREEAVRLLIKKEFDVNKVSESGYTPLMCAVETGRKNLVSILLKAGSNPNNFTPKDQNSFNVPEKVECINLVRTAEIALKETIGGVVSYNKNALYKADFAKEYLSARAEGAMRKIFSGVNLEQDEKIFVSKYPYFKKKTLDLATSLEYSGSVKLPRDAIFKVLEFLPQEEIVRIGPNLIACSSKNKIKITDPASPQVKFIGGVLIGTLVVNPAIRYLRDYIKGENEDKYFSDYYEGILTMENLINIATGFTLPIATKFLSAYLCVPEYIVGDKNYLPEMVAHITNSRLSQGVLQSTLFEVAALTIDAAQLVGDTMYCKIYDCV